MERGHESTKYHNKTQTKVKWRIKQRMNNFWRFETESKFGRRIAGIPKNMWYTVSVMQRHDFSNYFAGFFIYFLILFDFISVSHSNIDRFEVSSSIDLTDLSQMIRRKKKNELSGSPTSYWTTSSLILSRLYFVVAICPSIALAPTL